jgi:hypothetical protein
MTDYRKLAFTDRPSLTYHHGQASIDRVAWALGRATWTDVHHGQERQGQRTGLYRYHQECSIDRYQGPTIMDMTSWQIITVKKSKERTDETYRGKDP